MFLLVVETEPNGSSFLVVLVSMVGFKGSLVGKGSLKYRTVFLSSTIGDRAGSFKFGLRSPCDWLRRVIMLEGVIIRASAVGREGWLVF